MLELNSWEGVAPRGVVNIWGGCWLAPPPWWLDELELLGTGWVTLELEETRLDSRELEVWQEAEEGVARVTQGWIRTSSVVNLCVGSFLSKHRMRHLARELILSGNVNWPRRILANRPVCSWPWNGYLKKFQISKYYSRTSGTISRLNSTSDENRTFHFFMKLIIWQIKTMKVTENTFCQGYVVIRIKKNIFLCLKIK